MATNPKVPAAGQSQIEDPWKGITARDILLEPKFHQLPLSSRKYILDKVWPEFTKSSQEDQDATLGIGLDDWLSQAEETAPRAPGWWDQAWGKVKDTVGQGIEALGQTLPAQGISQRERVGGALIESGQRAKQFVETKIPDWTKAGESLYKSTVAVKDAAAKRMQQFLEPPPDRKPSAITSVGPRGIGVSGPFKPFTEVRPLEPPPVYPAEPAPTPAKKTGQVYPITGISGKEAKAPGIRTLWGFTDFWKSLWEEQKQYAPTLPVLSEKGKNYLPFGGPINESLYLWDVSRAAKRSSEGKASAADIKVLEDYQNEQQFSSVKGMEIARSQLDEIFKKPISQRTQEDFKFIDDVKNDRIDYADLATGRGEKVGSILAQYGGFAIEMAATSGAFSGVRSTAKAILLRSLRSLVKPDQKIMRAALKLAGQATGTTAGAAVQTLVMPQMILRTGLQKKLQGEVMPKLQEAQDVVTKMGLERGAMPRPDEVKSAIEHSLQDYQDDFLPHMLMAVPDTFAELLTERAGGILEGGIGRLAKMPVGKRISAVKETLLNRFLGLPGSSTRTAMQWIRSRTGWNGVAGEVFEERVADLMHEAQGRLGIEEKIGDEAPATWRFITGEGSRLEAFKEMMDQIVNETIAFSVPGMVGGVYSRVAGKVQRSIIKGKLVAEIEEIERQKVEAAGARPPGIAPPPPLRGPAGLTEPTIRGLKKYGFSDQEVEVMDAPLAQEALTWLMMQERAQQEMTRQAAPATAPPEGVAPITPTEGIAPPPLGAPLRDPSKERLTQEEIGALFAPFREEAPPMSERFSASQRVTTPDGPGVVEGIEKSEQGDIVRVQLDSGGANTYPTPMISLEPGQEVVAPHPEIEESIESLRAQVESLVNGKRFAVVLPPNLSKEDVAKVTESLDDPTWGRVDHPKKGTAFFDPTKITEERVWESLDTGNEHILMGAVEPLSDQTTTEVRVIDRNGVQVDLHRVSPDNADEEARRLASSAPEGATIEITANGEIQVVQQVDSPTGVLEAPPAERNLNTDNKIAIGLALTQEDYIAARPFIPESVMPGSAEEDGYVYGAKFGRQKITPENINTVKAALDPGLGGAFASAAGKGFDAARAEEDALAIEPPTPAEEPAAPAEMQSWKTEFKAGREQSWGTNALRFATEAEADAHGSELLSRWWGADEHRVVQSPDPVRHRFEDGRVVDIEVPVEGALVAPPENSMLIYTPWGVLPRETTGDRTEERADQAIDAYDRMLEEMESKNPKASSTDAYQEIKRNRDEVAWGRRPDPVSGVKRHRDPVLTLREWPADTPTPRMMERGIPGHQATKALLDFMLRDDRADRHRLNREILTHLVMEKSNFTDDQIDRSIMALDKEIEAERQYDQALATTGEDLLVAIRKMFGTSEFYDKFIGSGGSYSVFHNLVTSRAKSQESVTIDLPDGTRLDVTAKFGQVPKVEVQRYAFLLGRTPAPDISGKALTKSLFDYFVVKMKEAAVGKKGTIALTGDQIVAVRKAIAAVEKAMPGSSPDLTETEILPDYTIGHLAIEPATVPKVAGLRALATRLSQSTNALDQQIGRMIKAHAPSIFTTERPIEEAPAPAPAPHKVEGQWIVSAMWIFEGVSRATAWVYKDESTARTAVKQVGETAKPKDAAIKQAPKGWTEDDIRRTLRDRWGVSDVEIILDGAGETAEAKKEPAVAAEKPANPYEGKMPLGVKYIGAQLVSDGTYAHIFGMIDPETTVTIYPGDSLIEKVGEARQGWAEDQRKAAVAREGTEHPRMVKPPFSHSRNLPNDPDLSAKVLRSRIATMKALQEQGIADRIIEFAIGGLDRDQTTTELLKMMPSDQSRTMVRLQVIAIHELKGIPKPNTETHRSWKERVARLVDEYNQEPGASPSVAPMPPSEAEKQVKAPDSISAWQFSQSEFINRPDISDLVTREVTQGDPVNMILKSRMTVQSISEEVQGMTKVEVDSAAIFFGVHPDPNSVMETIKAISLIDAVYDTLAKSGSKFLNERATRGEIEQMAQYIGIPDISASTSQALRGKIQKWFLENQRTAEQFAKTLHYRAVHSAITGPGKELVPLAAYEKYPDLRILKEGAPPLIAQMTPGSLIQVGINKSHVVSTKLRSDGMWDVTVRRVDHPDRQSRITVDIRDGGPVDTAEGLPVDLLSAIPPQYALPEGSQEKLEARAYDVPVDIQEMIARAINSIEGTKRDQSLRGKLPEYDPASGRLMVFFGGIDQQIINGRFLADLNAYELGELRLQIEPMHTMLDDQLIKYMRERRKIFELGVAEGAQGQVAEVVNSLKSKYFSSPYYVSPTTRLLVKRPGARLDVVRLAFGTNADLDIVKEFADTLQPYAETNPDVKDVIRDLRYMMQSAQGNFYGHPTVETDPNKMLIIPELQRPVEDTQAMPNPPPRPEDTAPVVTFKKAKIIPTRAGYIAIPEKEEPEPPTPMEIPEDAEIEAARKQVRDALKKKRGGPPKSYAMATEDMEEISAEDLLEDQDILEGLVKIGEKYHAAGASREIWHSSMWHEGENIQDGFGDNIEEIFPSIWQAITGEEDYAGGKGGVYGLGGRTEKGAGGRGDTGLRLPDGTPGGLHGGIQPAVTGPLGEEEGAPGISPESGALGTADLGPVHEEGPERDPSMGTGGVGATTGPGGRPRDDGRFYKLTEADGFGQGTPGQKIEGNIEAIRILIDLRASGEPATEEQRKKLAKFIGWGAFQNVFDENKRYQNENAYRELRTLLSGEEWARARASTIHAFYTDFDIAKSMWYVLDQLGFKGNGTVVEPALGNGVLLGTAPDHIANSSSFLATELDLITAEIARHLYPAAKIFARGYEKLEFPDGTIDVYISNPPFGGDVYDPRYPDIVNTSIHDYFFIKSLDKLREGGLLIFVTSRYSMDKTGTAVRQMMIDRADLVTAIRLPNTAFMDAAGTAVTTDIIVMKKRAAGDPRSGESFLDLIEIDKDIKINEFFARHPENILGKMTLGHGLYSNNEVICVPFGDPRLTRGARIAEMIRAVADKLPAGIYQEDTENRGLQAINFANRFAPENVWQGQIIIDPETNQLMRNRNGSMVPIEPELVLAQSNDRQIRDLIGLRDALWAMFRIQLEAESDDVLEEPRRILNQAYDRYVAEYGLVDSRRTKALFGLDPTYFYLIALEKLDPVSKKTVKSDVFSKRTMRPQMVLSSLPDDPRQALLMVYAHKGFADLALMAKLTGKTADEWERDLRDQRLLFRDPQSGKLELPEQYLSGDVISKWEAALNSVDLDPSYQVNVDALKEVWPKQVPITGGELGSDGKPQNIEVRLGATWIELSYYESFIKHLFGEDVDSSVTKSDSGKFTLTVGDSGTGRGRGGRASRGVPHSLNYATWGVPNYPATDLIEDALNQQRPSIYVEDEQGNKHKDKKATMAAIRMQLKIRNEFDSWARTSAVAQQMQDDYNYKFNRIKLREYDGSHLTFDGMCLDVLRRHDLDPHQKNAVWRIILEGRGLLAHGVGLGKTWTMVAAAMEMKRMGIAHKPMFGAPKNVVYQFANDFARLYPGAKILCPTEKDFTPQNRKKLLARMAVEDWDGIILTHDQLKMIPISPERMAITVNEELWALEQTKMALEAEGGQTRAHRINVKRIEKAIMEKRAALAKMADLAKDQTVFFDHTGIDYLFVDEAHKYKNLGVSSKIGNVSGLSTQGNKQSLDLKAKVDFLLDKGHGRGVILATGTPVSNSMVELYTMTRYVAPEVLRNAGIKIFDDWAANFGNVVILWSPGPDGLTYRAQPVFAEFSNLPELSVQIRSFTDVVMREDVIGLPIPEVLGGGTTRIEVPMTEEASKYFDQIRARAATLESGNFDPHLDNWPKLTGDAKKASLDLRLLDPGAPDLPDSKVNVSVRHIAEYYHKHAAKRKTQVIFSEWVHLADGSLLYEDMKTKLVALGADPAEIAIIHDYKALEYPKLYSDISDGKIRILLTTRKTAEGANLQGRLGKLYHLDAPWTPKDIEQREGRILRQGNLHFEWQEPIEIVQYYMKRSYDGRLFEILRKKAHFVRAYLKGDTNVRSASDPSAAAVLNFEMISVQALDNPEALLRIQLQNDIAELEDDKSLHMAKIRLLKSQIEASTSDGARISAGLSGWRKVLETYLGHRDTFSLNIDGTDFTDPDAAIEHLRKMKESGRPNPAIEKLQKAGKEVPADMPATVPYEAKVSGRYLSFEGAVEKVNFESDTENQKIAFTATIAGETFSERAKADAALRDLLKRNDPGDNGKFSVDITIYGIPVQVRVDRYTIAVSKARDEKGEKQVVVNLYYNIANLETFPTTDVTAIIASADHKFRTVADRIAAGEDLIKARTKDLANMKIEVSKPWDGQEDLEIKRHNLVEINKRLGIKDDEGLRDEEDEGDPDDATAEDPEEESDDDDDFSDRFYSLMDPYDHIPRKTEDTGIRAGTYLQGTRETPTGDAFPEISKSDSVGEDVSEGRQIQEARRQQEFPELGRDEKLGPAFMFEAEATPEIIAELDRNNLPDTFKEKLKLAGRQLSETIQIVKLKAGRYEISDGYSVLSVYANENGGLEVWDPAGWGRIEIPELLWMIEQITKNPLGLTRKLRRATGHFVPDDKGGYIEVRPELFFDVKHHEYLARTITHELGHAIDFQPDFDMSRGNLLGRILSLHKFLRQTHGELKGIRNKNLKEELRKLSNFWRPWDPAKSSESFRKYRNSAVELYADFISATLLSPGTAEALAPTFYRSFHRKLDLKPEVKEEYFKMRLMVQGTKEEMLDHRLQRLGTMLKTAEEMNVAVMLQDNLRSRSWGAGFRDSYDDYRWEIKERVRKEMRAGVFSASDAANPLYRWDEFPVKTRTDMYRHAEKVMDEVIEPLKKLGLDEHDLGGYMFLHRSATERLNMANPIFGPGKYAVATLEHLRKTIGDDKYKALESAAVTYHDIRWAWVEAGLGSGIYSQSVFENKLLPNKYDYAKYTPLGYLDQYVSPTVKSQIGYAGPIANTFIETLKLDMALIRLIALNDAKTASIDFLKKSFPREVKKAPIVNPGDKMKIFKRPPRGFDLVEVLSNGETVGYHVDQYIAESLNTVSPDAALGLTRWAELFNKKYFWPVTILFNLGFSGWGNPWRDFWSNYKKLPLKTAVVGDLFQLLKAYKKAMPHAWEWVQGRQDEATREMIDSYAYSLPLSDVITDEMNSLNLVLKKAGFIHDIREIHKGIAGKVYNRFNEIKKFMEAALAFQEMTSKLAGWMIRKDAGEAGRELAFNVRNFTSTPNFDTKGHKTRTSNSWMPFSNIIKEGWKSEYLVATDPKMRSGYWFRTSKLMSLKLLTLAAEMGWLGWLVGDDLEKAYASISRYLKNNYFCIPLGPPDENGRVSVFTLPEDEGTRLLGAIMREMVVMWKEKDTQTYEELMKFVWSQLPSLTPMAKVPIGIAAWFGFSYNFPDTFRMTPVLPETIAKAEGLPAATRILQWSISELGMGQFTTWDDSKKTFFQWWTSTDPTVGKLVGRMFRVTNYGITERQRAELTAIEKERAGQSVERREMPGVAAFYQMNYQAATANTLLKAAISKGAKYKDAILDYPEAADYRGMSSTMQRISRLQKRINTVEADKSLTDQQRSARVASLRVAMEDVANRAVSSAKGRRKSSQESLAAPPGTGELLPPPVGLIRDFPNLPEPPR